jgi:hypothetical protein
VSSSAKDRLVTAGPLLAQCVLSVAAQSRSWAEALTILGFAAGFALLGLLAYRTGRPPPGEGPGEAEEEGEGGG